MGFEVVVRIFLDCVGERDVVFDEVFSFMLGIVKFFIFKKLRIIIFNRSKLKSLYRICMYGDIFGLGVFFMVDMIFLVWYMNY